MNSNAKYSGTVDDGLLLKATLNDIATSIDVDYVTMPK